MDFTELLGVQPCQHCSFLLADCPRCGAALVLNFRSLSPHIRDPVVRFSSNPGVGLTTPPPTTITTTTTATTTTTTTTATTCLLPIRLVCPLACRRPPTTGSTANTSFYHAEFDNFEIASASELTCDAPSAGTGVSVQWCGAPNTANSQWSFNWTSGLICEYGGLCAHFLDLEAWHVLGAHAVV